MQFRSITELHWNTTKKLLFVFTLSVGISTTEHSYNQVTRKHFITFLHEDRQHLRFLRAPIISANRRREYKKPHHFWTFVFTASTSALTYYKKKKKSRGGWNGFEERYSSVYGHSGPKHALSVPNMATGSWMCGQISICRYNEGEVLTKTLKTTTWAL